jgi:hypothetical protein
MNSINVALSRRLRHQRQPPSSLVRRLVATGYEDAPPLTTKAVEGEHPRGRELSMAWLAGTVMTGLTSVLLMGAALYVSFQGQENFSTASEAMLFPRSSKQTSSSEKGDRPRPVAQTRSDIEVIEASIRELVEGRTMIRSRHSCAWMRRSRPLPRHLQRIFPRSMHLHARQLAGLQLLDLA